MAAEELDLKAQYERNPKVVPTVILQIVDDYLVVMTGPRPVPREEYIYDWDTTWNEPGTEVVAVEETIQFQKTVADQPTMIQRCLDEFGETGEAKVGEIPPWTFNDPEGLGNWIWDVLHGKDPR
jgi:hypothetical protein